MLLRPSRAGQRSGWPILCTAVRTELTTSRVTGHSCLLTQLRMIRVPCHGRCPLSSAPGRCCCEIVPASTASGHGTITNRCRSPKTGTQAAGRLLRSFVLEPFVWVSMLMSIGWRRFFCFLLIFDSIFISVVPRNLQDSNGNIGKSKVCASVCAIACVRAIACPPHAIACPSPSPAKVPKHRARAQCWQGSPSFRHNPRCRKQRSHPWIKEIEDPGAPSTTGR